MATIKDVANKAGVSVATVSHVLNKTRYVSPERIDAVKKAINELHYTPLRKTSVGLGRNGVIGLIVPDLSAEKNADFAHRLTINMNRYNFGVEILDSFGNSDVERENLLLMNMQSYVHGIVLIPTTDHLSTRLSKLRKPCVVVGSITVKQSVDTVLPEYEKAARQATMHLLRTGHETINLILDRRNSTTQNQEYKDGFQAAYRDNRSELPANYLFWDTDITQKNIKAKKNGASAFICANEKIATDVLFKMGEADIHCPDDISIISLEWNTCHHVHQPTITAYGTDTDLIVEKTKDILLRRIEGEKCPSLLIRIPVQKKIEAFTKIIGRGPFGEKLASKNGIYLTEEEIHRLQAGKYTSAILFQFSGKRWMRLIEQSIRNIFTKLGIQILDSFDADSNSDRFIHKAREIMSRKPDILLCAAANDRKTEDLYKEIAESDTKLFFVGRVPKGLQKQDYTSCVLSNEQESGYNCIRMLSKYFKGQPVDIGLMTYSSNYIPGRERDVAAEKAVLDLYPHLKIVAREGFTLKNYAYEVCLKMIREHPSIQGIYVTWEDPAIQTISALMDAGREDIKIVTADLDTEVAQDMANKRIVVGISAQMPYDQGEVLALAAANTLLGKPVPKVIGVPPLVVTRENLEDAWYQMTKEKAPNSIVQALHAF